MAEMRMTFTAFHFCAFHSIRIIGKINEAVFADRFKKAWPSTTAVELSIATKKRVTANRAIISPYLIMLIIFPCSGPFSSFLPGNVINIVGQYFLPFFVTYFLRILI